MHDDHDRLKRLREAPRTDIAMGRRMERFVEALQTRIVKRLEELEAQAGSEVRFRTDLWEREGGGGRTCVIEKGAVFEKGGVDVSAVHGALAERAARSLGVGSGPFFATGLSLVIHPRNPFVPTVHANLRYFALGEDRIRPEAQWFDGGADLVPVYPKREDAVHFHRVWKRVCDDHPDVAEYDRFKQWCDDYFFLPHREEALGVGGIFFDRLGADDPEGAFFFTREVGRAFLSSYTPIVERHVDREYGDRERIFQRWRRGRYAEFSLLYDRRTQFGLRTGGRTESILMGLPPHVDWRYNWSPEPNTREAEALQHFTPTDWLGVET